MTTLVSDAFTRADGSIEGANGWADGGSVFISVTISSNKATVGGSDTASLNNGAAFANDQWSQGVITVTNGAPTVRHGLGTGQGSFYFPELTGTLGGSSLTVAWGKFVNGSYTGISSQGSQSFNSGDTLYAEVQGTTLQAKRNGSNFGSSQTDSSLSAGVGGIFGYSGFTIDDFAAGDFAGGGGAYNAVPLLEYYQQLRQRGVFH